MIQPDRPHVLKVLRGFAHDGPGLLTLNLLRAWQPDQVRVSVLALEEHGPLREAMTAEITRLGGRIHTLPSRWRRWRQCANYLTFLAYFINATHLHGHLIRADMVARTAARRLGLPYLVTEHGLHGWSERGRALRPLVRGWYRWYQSEPTLVCAVSAKVRRDLVEAGLAPSRIRVVENGVDLSQYQPVTPEAKRELRRRLDIPETAFPVIAVVGSLKARKSPETALFALHAMMASDRDLQPYLVYAGDGPLHQRLQLLSRALGRQSRVRFCRHVDNTAAILGASDLLLHPAREEPFGLAVAEALASGLPVVSRAGSGADELLPENGPCCTVDTDEPHVWSDCITRAVTDPDTESSALTRRHADNRFCIRRAARQYLQLYEATRTTTRQPFAMSFTPCIHPSTSSGMPPYSK